MELQETKGKYENGNEKHKLNRKTTPTIYQFDNFYFIMNLI